MSTERIQIIVEERGSRIVQVNLTGIGGAAAKSASAVDVLRRSLGGLSVAAALALTVREMARFEQALSTVKAVSGATDTEMKSLRDTAMNLGLSTRYSATQAAEGILLLKKAGLTLDETMQSVAATLRLAQAGTIELGRASEITVNIMRSFHMNVDQVAHITDVLAKTANETTADVQGIAYSMKFAGPVAHSFGVSLEETAAAAGILSNAGLEASMAGTGLRRIFSELATPTTQAKKLLRDLGLSTKDYDIVSIGMTQTLQNLKNAGVGAAAGLQLFGDRGGPAFDVLIRRLPDIRALNTLLVDSKDYCKGVATVMDQNLNGALLHLKASLQAVQLRLGEVGGSSLLTKFVQQLTEGVRFLANHIQILEGALIGLAVGAIPRVIQGIGLLLRLVGGGWIVLFGAVIGALVSFRDEIKMSADSSTTLADFGTAAFERMKISGQLLVDTLRDQFGGLTDVFDGVNFSIRGLVVFTARALDSWIGFWRGTMIALGALLANLGPALKDIAIDIINDLIGVADSGLKKFYAVLGRIPGKIGEPYRRLATEGLLPQIENVAEGASKRLGEAVVIGFTAGFNQITVFEDSVNGLLDRADQIAKERLKKQTQGAGLPTTPTGVGGAPPSEDLPRELSKFNSGISAGMDTISKTINNYGQQVETTLVNAFNNAEDALVSFVTTGKVDFKSLVTSILGDLTRLVSRMAISGLMGKGGSDFSSLGRLFGGLGGGGGMGSESAINAAFASAENIGRANGGSAAANRPIVVGERGKEIFVPSVPGQVIPNNQAYPMRSAAAQEPPKVTIIQVNSMDEAWAAMRSSEGQRIILSTRGG
jgi:TP901 family phage tail tape measure protein